MASKSDFAYEKLKEKIINGELAPLSDIVEEKLQEEFEVSRTPIREALQRLNKEGFVYVYARKGTIVAGIDMNLIHSVYEARLLNEPYLSRNVCNDIPEEWLQKMRKALVSCPYDINDPEYRNYYIKLDSELHSTILSYSKNQFLNEAMKNVCDHSERLRIRTSRRNEEYERSINEHIVIIDAFLKRDPDKIEAVTRVHIETARKEAFKYNIL